MPCNWSTTANSFLRKSWTTTLYTRFQVTRYHSLQRGPYAPFAGACTSPASTPTRQLSTILRLPPLHCLRQYKRRLIFHDFHSSPPSSYRLLSCAARTDEPPLGTRPFSRTPPTLAPNADSSTPSSSTSLTAATAHLTSAQLSRVTAQTVRVCVRDGDFGDALYVVNSACHSALRDPLHSAEEKNGGVTQLKPIDFGRPVSPRLAAHAFLHGLVRGGYTLKARTYAKLMVQAGIPIRSRTLESVVAPGASSQSVLPRFGPFARIARRKPIEDQQSVLQLQTSMVADECSRAAVELLQTARTFGQQRTERMYKLLISTLLLQGEIIVASLLFVVLVKDWELRKVHDASVQEEPKKLELSHEHLGLVPPSHAALIASPYPDLTVMGQLMDDIDARFRRASDQQSDPKLFPFLQSLAMFAMLLDTGQLHTPRIAPIIRTLSHCPKINATVWILHNGQPVQVNAYQYFHDVLIRLIDSLSEQSERPPQKLSRRAYNTLLSYSLRHRLSPSMASTILQHMCVKREPPIMPDTVTYNILLRSGTLLRQVQISEVALTALRSISPGSHAGGSPWDLPDTQAVARVGEGEGEGEGRGGTRPDAGQRVTSSDMLAQLRSEKLILPKEVLNAIRRPKPTPSTLTSFITHLTSSGRPDRIVDILFDILPELYIIDHPATNGQPRRRMKMNRGQALSRAVHHGPYVYAALINALAKAGELGLAERVFLLAQQAERASHLPNFAEGVQPWRLSVHAYTSMLQCYARVALKRVPPHKLSEYYCGNVLLERGTRWKPTARHYRKGYAYYVHGLGSRRPQERYTKRQTTRRNAMLLFRSMMSGGRALIETMILNCSVHPLGVTPRRAPKKGEPWWFLLYPDARFFNAALKMFAPRVRHPRSREYWRRRRMQASTRQVTWMLHKLAQTMEDHGYPVPEAYQYMLGRKQEAPSLNPRKDPVRRPYAFANLPIHHWRADAIPTVKTRGLPVRKPRAKRRKGRDTSTVA